MFAKFLIEKILTHQRKQNNIKTRFQLYIEKPCPKNQSKPLQYLTEKSKEL